MVYTRRLSVVVEEEPQLVDLFRSSFERLDRFFHQGSNITQGLSARARDLQRTLLPLNPGMPGVLSSDQALARDVLSGSGLVVVTTLRPSITGGSMSQFFLLTAAASVVRQLRRLTARPVMMVAWLRRPDVQASHIVGVDDHGNAINPRPNMKPATVVERALSAEPHYSELQDVVSRSFGPLWESTGAWRTDHSSELREGFARLLVELFAKVGVIVIDEESPGVASTLAPFIHLALSRSSTLNRAMRGKALLLRREGLMVDLPPVHMTNVRYMPGEGETRAAHTIEMRDGRALGRNQEGRPAFSYSLPTFLRILNRAPERFMPDYRLRPLAQAWCMPVAAYIVDTKDLALHALTEEAYELLDLSIPITMLGHRLLLLPDHVQGLLGEYWLSLGDVWSDLDEKRDQVISRTDRLNLAAREHHLKLELTRAVDEATAGLDTLDAAIPGQAAELTRELHELTQQFFRDAMDLHRHSNIQVIEDFRTIESWLHPRGKAQWHVFCPLPFLANYGLDLVSELSELSPDPIPQLALLRATQD